ncbi:MAG: hypothetical protein E7448_07610 [Ruminococcaceae bacterium]|nr:hypothetical protein [Oscillospiraceae bacterium]
MKFLKNHISLLVAVAGGIAVMILRQLHLATANEAGLLVRDHITGIFALILSVAILALLLWRSLVLPKEQTCRFPASIPATVGYALGAFGIAYTAVGFFRAQTVTVMPMAAFVGVVAAVALLIMAGLRFQGLAANVLYHAAVCVFFLLLLLCQYQLWSSEPQMPLYAYAMVATAFLSVGGFHRACFDGKMGQLRQYAFFRAGSVFFCLAAIPGSDLWVLYLTGALWSAADILNLSVVPEEGG